MSVLKLIPDFIDEILEVSQSETTASSKTKRTRNLAKVLNGAINDPEYYINKKVELNTISSYYTTIRGEIAKTGLFHHGFKKEVSKILEKYKDEKFIKLISNIDGLTNKEVAENIRDIKKEIEGAIENKTNVENKKLVTKMSAAHKAISSLKVHNEAYYCFVLTDMQRTMLAKKAEESLIKSIRNYKFINKEEVINLTKEMLSSSNIYELLLGIALATGRRVGEVAYSGEFEVVDANSFDFCGILKKGDNKKKIKINIYSTIETDLVHKAIEKFRTEETVVIANNKIKVIEKEKGDYIKAVNWKYSTPANAHAKRQLSKLNAKVDFTFKDSRAIWVKMILDMGFKPKEVNEIHFVKEQLGHDDYVTQIHYKTYEFTEEKNTGKFEEEKKVAFNEIIGEEVISSLTTDMDIVIDEYQDWYDKDKLIIAHNRMKEFVEYENPNLITRTILTKPITYKGVGMGVKMGKKYFDLIKELHLKSK